MTRGIVKTKIICHMEMMINKGCRVIIFDDMDKSLLRKLLEGIRYRNLSDVEVWHVFEDFENNGLAEKITKSEMEEVLRLYRLYDFSDRVSVIGRSSQYGSLFNYVDNGIMTKNEMITALIRGL